MLYSLPSLIAWIPSRLQFMPRTINLPLLRPERDMGGLGGADDCSRGFVGPTNFYIETSPGARRKRANRCPAIISLLAVSGIGVLGCHDLELRVILRRRNKSVSAGLRNAFREHAGNQCDLGLIATTLLQRP